MPPDGDQDTFLANLERLANDAARHAPAWLEPIRSGAQRRLPRLTLPDRRTERWKYTPVRSLFAADWQAPVAATAPAPPPALTDILKGAHATLVDGLCSALQTPPDGVEINAFGNLSASQQALVGDLLDRRGYPHYAFADVNSALLRDGLFVHVHTGANGNPPTIVLNQALTGRADLAAQPRILVLVDPGARANLIEISHAPGGSRGWNNTLSEIQLGRDAALNHARVQLEPATVSCIGGCEVRLGANARYSHQCVLTGGALRRTDLTVASAAPGAEVQVDGLLLAGGREHIDLHVDLEHAHPHGRSDTSINALASERARVVFNGRIHIHPGASGTAAHLNNRNLCLSSDAQINTKPELEIYNDDVQCSHGATVGNLDADALFYLRSRGLDARRAHALLVAAFADERLAALGVACGQPLVDAVRTTLHARIAEFAA